MTGNGACAQKYPFQNFPVPCTYEILLPCLSISFIYDLDGAAGIGEPEDIEVSAFSHVIGRGIRCRPTGGSETIRCLGHIRFPADSIRDVCLHFEPSLFCLRAIHFHVHHPVMLAVAGTQSCLHSLILKGGEDYFDDKALRVQGLIAGRGRKMGGPGERTSICWLPIIRSLSNLYSIPVKLSVPFPPGIVFVVVCCFSQG